jgi:hypothetical protein
LLISAIKPSEFSNTSTNVQKMEFLKSVQKEKNGSQMPMTLACNLTYSGGRDQEDLSLKPAQANSS